MILLLPSILGFYDMKLYLLLFVLNLVVHMITDSAKANWMKINLIADQCIHIIQIVLTWTFYVALR